MKNRIKWPIYNLQKLLIFLTLICMASVIYSQKEYWGLVSNHYTIAENGHYVKKNGLIYIIFNDRYLTFFLEGKGLKSFSSRNYTKSLDAIQKSIHTSFVSEETETTPDGYYGVMIDEFNSSTIFQISITNGVTYIVENAKKYTEDGKIGNNAQINWAEAKRQKIKEDSIIKVKKAEREQLALKGKIEDSIFQVNQKANKLFREDSIYALGNNYNPMLINWLADTLKAKMKLATGDMIYSNFKIFIDQDGFITDASPSGSAGHFIPKYLPEIVNIIKGIKLIPFKGKNGKNYSSYTDVYISIIPKNFSR